MSFVDSISENYVTIIKDADSISRLINAGARASARFNVGKPGDFWPKFDHCKLKRRERRAPLAIHDEFHELSRGQLK
jgi:hypothetical protein